MMDIKISEKMKRSSCLEHNSKSMLVVITVTTRDLRSVSYYSIALW